MPTHLRGSRAALILVLALALTATACAGDDDAVDTATDAAAAAAPDPTTAAADDASAPEGTTATPDAGGVAQTTDDARGVEVTGELGEKPAITLPGDEPPAELVAVDLVEGDGDEVQPGDTVTTHYVGVSWLNDGEEFDSSWDRPSADGEGQGQPATFPLDGVVQGWSEGIPGMRAGGRRLLIIPPELAYGDQPPSPAIAAGDTLVFVIDLVPPPEPVTPGTDAMGVEVGGEVGEAPEITLPGGEPPSELVVVDLVEGDGEEVPVGATVTTHYSGVSWLNDGAQFDSSWDRGEPATFPLDGVIPGWTQGIPGMRVGGRRLLIIPPELAYGDSPPSDDIAAGDTLVFVIDLVEVS